MSVTRSALAKETSELQVQENEFIEEKIEIQIEQGKSKLDEYEDNLDQELIKNSQELSEVYEYYQVKYCFNENLESEGRY